MTTAMQTPISHAGHSREPSVVSSTASRVRTLSDASAYLAEHHNARTEQMQPMSPPLDQQQNGEVEQFQIRRRSPQRNENDQYVCHASPDCAHLVFNRKCEWSKHMDKHDRPYRCLDPMCAKLQGFTYSGGLLRHEREVHGKHGGPKEKLQCPYPDCKRHIGNGFTRKENRDEHVRRVHLKRKDEIPAMTAIRNEMDTLEVPSPRSPNSAPSPDDTSSVLGKRRFNPSASPEVDDLHAEIRRLRAHNDDLQQKLDRLQNQMRLSREELRGTAHGLTPASAAAAAAAATATANAQTPTTPTAGSFRPIQA